MKEIAAVTLTTNPIERPDNIDGDYLEALFHDSDAVSTLFNVTIAGWRGYLAQAAQASGKYSVDLRPRNTAEHEGEKSLFTPTDDQLEATFEEVGSIDHSTKVQVRKDGKGFILSFPIQRIHKDSYQNSGLSPSSISQTARLFPNSGAPGDALVTHHRPGSDSEFVAFLDHVIPNAKDRKDFYTRSQPLDITIPFDASKEHVGFNVKKEGERVYADTLKAISKYVSGYRLIGPAIPDQAYYAGQPKVADTAVTTIKDAANPNDFALWIAQNREVTVFVDIKLPADFAAFIGQSHNPAPANILVWFMAWMRYWVGDSSTNHVEAVRPMSSIRDENKSRPNHSKTNHDGLMISPDGYFYYIPTVDNVDHYEEAFHNFADRGDGVFTLNDQRTKDKPENKLPANKIIYTDWENLKVAYSDSSGLINILDLEGFQPVSSTQARNFLDLPMLTVNTRSKIKHIMGTISYTMRNRAGARTISTMPQELQKALVATGCSPRYVADAYESGEVTKFTQVVESYVRTSTEMMTGAPNSVPELFREWIDTYGPDLEDLRFHAMFDHPLFSWVGAGLSAVFQSNPSLTLATHPSEHDQEAVLNFIQTRYPLSGMEELGTLIALVKYGKNYPKIVARDLEARRTYLNPEQPGYAWDPKPLPYVADNRALMPHQARIDGLLTLNKPSWTVIDVDAGGGKTGIVLRNIVDLLDSKKIKRPCIACPSFLVKNYIEENVYFYDGRMNMIVLSTDTLNQYGEDGLRRMVEGSPVNTILLTDFGFLSNHHRNRDVFYGNGVVTINLNAEFLTSLGIDYMAVDESHQLRNEESNRSQAARKLALTMDNKAIATGTFITNQVSDTAGQFALFDPSVFGNKQDFIDEFADIVHGGKVIKWKDNAESEIRKRISEQALLISARRKEWGAMLPHLKESIVPIGREQVNEEWLSAYQAILEETIEQIKANKALTKQMEDDNLDEMDLAGQLNPYLARLEMFMTAPELDPLGSKILKGDAAIGPKVKAVGQIVREHLAANIPGKILVITNYHASADSLYEHLPQELKSKFIRYHAGTKDRDIAKFKRDPNIIGMIGVEDSLGTGHNFQYCSRIVRIETKWNPGDLEQANSRIWRPDPKLIGGSDRGEVFIDWVIVDQTIDVCKFARLISKVLSKVKFDEAGNSKYDGLESLPIIKMNLDTIRNLNSIDRHLSEYAHQYSTYKNIYRKEMDDYRKKHADDFHFKPISNNGEGMEGGRMMRTVPYVREMQLPNADAVGIMRYSDYVDDHAEGKQGLADYNTVGLSVHTEAGDGKIVGMSASTLKIKLHDGTVLKSVNKLKTFIITDKESASPKALSIRDKIAGLIGLPIKKKRPAATKEEAPTKLAKEMKKVVEEAPKRGKKAEPVAEPAPTKLRVVKKKPAPEPEEETMQMDFYVESMYDYITLGTFEEDVENNEGSEDILKALGFRFTGPYVYATVRTKKHLANFLTALTSKYKVEPAYLKRLEQLQEFFNRGPKNAFNARSAIKSVELRNFWRLKRTKTDPGVVRPYAVVMDHELHIAFAITSMQPTNRKVPRNVRVPGVKWEESDGEYVLMCPNKATVKTALKELANSGIEVNDLDDIREELTALKTHTSTKSD